MKRVILSVTMGGLRTAQTIKQELGGDLFTLEKYCHGNDLRPITGTLKDFMAGIFQDYREIVMVMSCGIAVRSIAPYLNSKLTDPAVVVLDEKGNFSISLLSGHIGGANELAQNIALITKGQAVITTASDNLGLESVDMIAKKYQLYMDDLEQVKRVTATLVNGKRVVLVNDSSLNMEVVSIDTLELKKIDQEMPDALIYVGNKDELGLHNNSIPIAKLRLRNLVLGMGCKKDMDGAKLEEAVRTFFRQQNISLTALKAIATVDVKKEEPAILSLAEKMSLPVHIVDRSEIAPIEHRFPCSNFVKKTIGVGCVAEPAAYLVSKEGRLVVPKTAFDGITLCLYEEKR
ncbi:MAG: cobalt-precorrin 5A hydrolase [Dehalobacterium sp.]